MPEPITTVMDRVRRIQLLLDSIGQLGTAATSLDVLKLAVQVQAEAGNIIAMCSDDLC